MKKSYLYYAAIAFMIIGFIVYIMLLINPIFNDFSFNINNQLASNLGSSISGLVGSLFSLAGIILIIETLRAQNTMFGIQRFESKYFELIKIHRDNVNNLKKLSPTGVQWNGPQVFEEIHAELEFVLLSVDHLCELYKLDISKIDKGGIAFAIIFFGINDSFGDILNDFIKRHYDYLSHDHITFIFNDLFKLKYNNQEYKNRLVGHQTRLGHYYRHLYHTVKFVNDNNDLSFKNKYDYLKTLRAQLTTYEQSILFFNSLSVLGKNWRSLENNFIAKYQLIKNLPPKFTYDINPKIIYPNIIFEYEE